MHVSRAKCHLNMTLTLYINCFVYNYRLVKMTSIEKVIRAAGISLKSRSISETCRAITTQMPEVATNLVNLILLNEAHSQDKQDFNIT